jgi:hypothetical protein
VTVPPPGYPLSRPSPYESTALASVLLGDNRGRPLTIIGAYLLTWDGTTHENTVADGPTVYTNLDVLFPTLLAVGPVVLIKPPGRPIILARIYTPTPAA